MMKKNFIMFIENVQFKHLRDIHNKLNSEVSLLPCTCIGLLTVLVMSLQITHKLDDFKTCEFICLGWYVLYHSNYPNVMEINFAPS